MKLNGGRNAQQQGIKVAREAWKYRGRKTVITKKLIGEVQDLQENKKLSITQIAKVTGSNLKIFSTKKNSLDWENFFSTERPKNQ